MSQRSDIVVFVGPTLPVERGRILLDADFRPPAGQGDVYAAVESGEPKIIALIDGVFQTEPAVRHKEILWALHKGVRVFGAASLGALRAVELEPFGMVGIGAIYRWYRRFPMTPDDAVAVAQAPPELDSRPLGTALVDLIVTFRAARRAGAIDRRVERRLARAAVSLHYKDRSIRSAVDRARDTLGDEPAPGLTAKLHDVLVAQKQEDAALLLAYLANHDELVRNGEQSRMDTFVVTDSWYQDLMLSGQSPPPVARC